MAQAIWNKDYTGYPYMPVVWTATKGNTETTIHLDCFAEKVYRVNVFVDNHNIFLDDPTIQFGDTEFASLEDAKDWAAQYLR